MKKIILCFVISVSMFTLNGCSNSDSSKELETKSTLSDSSVNSESKDETESTSSGSTVSDTITQNSAEPNPSKVEEKQTPKDTTQKNIPEEVMRIYDSFEATIKDNGLNFSLSNVETSTQETSKFYSFGLEYPEAKTTTIPTVKFQAHENTLKKSFSVNLPNDCDNNTVKNVISCTIKATNPEMEYSMANQYMQQLANSFDGASQSQTVETESFKFYISPATSTLTNNSLEVVSLEEINAEIDTSEYRDYTSEEMQAPLNQGEKAHLSGSILGIYELESYLHALEVMSGNEKYLIYYNPSDFIDMFEVEQQRDFYGTIAQARDGYAGCLRIDYVE